MGLPTAGPTTCRKLDTTKHSKREVPVSYSSKRSSRTASAAGSRCVTSSEWTCHGREIGRSKRLVTTGSLSTGIQSLAEPCTTSNSSGFRRRSICCINSEVTMEKRIDPGVFVPAFPTIGPEMLLRRRRPETHHPFSLPGIHYFFFARNAIWHTAKMLGLDRGEVLVPSYHHGVEVEALIDAGAQVKFYRIGEKLEVDFLDVEMKIGPRTTALYLTHFAGFPGPVREMKKLAEKHALPLIEDCALSLFSMDGDVPLGITGDAAVFCLYKLLPVPNGGALVFNGPDRCNMAELPPPSASTTFTLISSSFLRNL